MYSSSFSEFLNLYSAEGAGGDRDEKAKEARGKSMRLPIQSYSFRQIQSTIELATNWGQIGDYVVWLGGRMGVDWSVWSRIRVECTVVRSVLYLSSTSTTRMLCSLASLSISSTTTLCSLSRAMAGNSNDDIGYAKTQCGFVRAIKVYCYYAFYRLDLIYTFAG